MPTYASGHPVTATQALDLREDTADWLGPVAPPPPPAAR
jgi:hypothetical protein